MDELLEKYLSLSEEERAAFEKELSPEQRAFLAQELGIMEGLNEEFRKELKSKVSAFEERSHRARKMNPAFIGVAASFLLISSLVVYLMRDESSLFDQYYEVYPNYEVTSLRGQEDSSVREKAYKAYDQRNYKLAIVEFTKLDSLLGADYLFRGIARIQIKNYKDALSDFNAVIDLHDKDYESAAQWYTALIKLKQEEQEEAIPILEKLSNGQSEFASVSTKLLEQL
ncbi:tetratricopeptide repeat protein [Ekhidna sp.]